MRFVFIVAAVAFLAELAVEGLEGFAGGGGRGLREGLVSGWHFCFFYVGRCAFGEGGVECRSVMLVNWCWRC